MSTNTLEEGLRLTLEKMVEERDLAINRATSGIAALSSSALIFFIEKAVANLLAPYLSEEEDTVSSEINIKHIKGVGVGHKVRCIVHLKYIEKRKLFFDIAVFDHNHDEVAIGAHCRYIVNKKAFEAVLK